MKERRIEKKNKKTERLKGSLTFRVTGQWGSPEVMRPFSDALGSLFCKFGKKASMHRKNLGLSHRFGIHSCAVDTSL